jgi:hypothetical protein
MLLLIGNSARIKVADCCIKLAVHGQFCMHSCVAHCCASWVLAGSFIRKTAVEFSDLHTAGSGKQDRYMNVN